MSDWQGPAEHYTDAEPDLQDTPPRGKIIVLVAARVGVLRHPVGPSSGWQLARLPIDAVPDITNKQSSRGAPSLSPVEWKSAWHLPD